MKNVFVVGRLPDRNADLADRLRSEGYRVTETAAGEETLRLLKGEACCELIVVGDPEDISPRGLLGGLGRRFPDLPALLLLPEPDMRSILRDPYLDLSGKPSSDVVDVIDNLLTGGEPEQADEGAVRLIGSGKAMERVRQTVFQVAPTMMTVLVTGESGTGKDVVARMIHAESGRRKKAFIAVNVAALPEGVLESELFGHEKGAFTGAISRRAGRFELADEGTLFLDEIGEMPVQTQAKLLRVLEEKRFLRVGGVKDVTVNVRLVAATNSDLESAVEEGRFREDLYYRLNVIQIHMPPLRERREDIPDLVRVFAAGAGADHGIEPIRFKPDALEYLASYHWPGNVRQLRNMIEKITILERGGVIDLDGVTRFLGERFSRSRNLPVPAQGRTESAERELIYQTLLAIRRDLAELKEGLRTERGFPPSFREERAGRFGSEAEVVELDETTEPSGSRTVAEFEAEAIRRALHESGGNRREAADILKIGQRTLYRKIKKYGLEQ